MITLALLFMVSLVAAAIWLRLNAMPTDAYNLAVFMVPFWTAVVLRRGVEPLFRLFWVVICAFAVGVHCYRQGVDPSFLGVLLSLLAGLLCTFAIEAWKQAPQCDRNEDAAATIAAPVPAADQLALSVSAAEPTCPVASVLPPPPPDAYLAASSSAILETPQVPLVVRAYGTFGMIESLVGLACVGKWFLASLTPDSILIAVLGSMLAIAVCAVFFRLGKGLRDGECAAVYGMCVLYGLWLLVLAIVVCIWILWRSYPQNSWTPGDLVVSLGLVSVRYLPPIVSAFRHWNAFV